MGARQSGFSRDLGMGEVHEKKDRKSKTDLRTLTGVDYCFHPVPSYLSMYVVNFLGLPY